MIRGGYWGGAWGLSWAGAWGEAWLLLNQPYQELDLKGQVFVRSYLTRIHSVEVAERIVAVAALNNISVIDAEVVVAAKLIPQSITISKKSKKAVQKAVENYPRKIERQPKSSIAAVSSNIPLYSFRELDRIEAVTVSESFFVSTKQPVYFFKNKKKRNLIESNN